MGDSAWYHILIASIRHSDQLKKAACLFAGLGHLQPLLLATTNSNYLLDRFCMERCCSSEYVSRIVTSIIFMEILSIIVVRIVLYGAFINHGTWASWSTEWQSDNAKGQTLNDWNENKEEQYRGYISCIILFLITLGYFHIFYAFIYGGKKGHVHWFYSSLLIQHFLNSLIAGSIGFWDVGLALWYLVTLPMAPIIVFFYQLYIHSWIRNNGPSDVEYLVVEFQIILATTLSILATIYWILGYVKSYIPIELEITNLDSGSMNSSDQTRINAGPTTLTTAKMSGDSATATKTATLGSGADVKAEVTLTAYSVTLLTAESGSENKTAVTLTLKAAVNIEFKKSGTVESVEVQSANKDPEKPVNLNIQGTPKANIPINHVTPDITVNTKGNNVILALAIEEIRVTANNNTLTIQSVEVTIPVKIVVKADTSAHTISTVKLTLPAKKSDDSGQAEYSKDQKLTLNETTWSGETLTIEVQTAEDTAGESGSNAKATIVQVSGQAFSPKNPGYCIYSVREATPGNKDIWANIGGKCTFAACYKNSSGNGALLILYFRSSGGLERKYFGRENANNNPWYEITETLFIQKLPALANGELSGLEGTATPQYNREYHNILKSPVWAPLIMQGLSVGAVGSIFPNLIPKTLTCPKTSRTLTVVNMFMVPIPHIFNVMLGDMDLLGRIGVGDDWKIYKGWPGSLLLYIFYILAILFAIFNIHYPEWALSSFLRNNTWMVFLMILFTDVLNESFNAISRAGICSQKSANDTPNHPCLHNKIACLMNLTYIPFWMTSTPMMKDL